MNGAQNCKSLNIFVFMCEQELFTSENLIVHYDCKLLLILACDVSPYGLGAVLSHRFPD